MCNTVCRTWAQPTVIMTFESWNRVKIEYLLFILFWTQWISSYGSSWAFWAQGMRDAASCSGTMKLGVKGCVMLWSFPFPPFVLACKVQKQSYCQAAPLLKSKIKLITHNSFTYSFIYIPCPDEADFPSGRVHITRITKPIRHHRYHPSSKLKSVFSLQAFTK